MTKAGSIRTRLALVVLGISVLSSAALVLVAGLSARLLLRDQLRQRLMAVASSGAVLVGSDAAAQLAREQQPGSPASLRVRRNLYRLREANHGIRDIYLVQPSSDRARWRVLANAEPDLRRAWTAGRLLNVSSSPAAWKALEGCTVDADVLKDDRGSWLSGYAPIRDSGGHTIAVVGAVISANGLAGQEDALVAAVAITGLILLVFSTLLAGRFCDSFAEPLAALADAAARVADGDLETEVGVQGPREVRTLASSFNAMTEALCAHRARTEQLAHTDFLTSLHNHRYFQERLEQEVGRAARYRHPLGLILLDLDHFRQINSTYGHQNGDHLLTGVAALIRGVLRECDVPTRYGGEEFAIILPETTAAEAYEAAERIRAAVDSAAFDVYVPTGRDTVHLTISGGVAEYPGDSTEKEGLLLAVDVALLRAKHMLRNRTCRFAEEDIWPTGGIDPANLHAALQDANIAAVESLAQALDARDHYTRGHSENVTRLAIITAEALGIPKDEQQRLETAGLLHDIGKIGIPDSILLKRGRLEREEWELIRSHPSIGASILDKAPMLREIVPMVLGHHERYDGGGYPNGTRGESIPLGARILAVADAYDAMTSERPYRAAMTQEEAIAELRRCEASQFDPIVVVAFRRALARLDPAAPRQAAEASG